MIGSVFAAALQVSGAQATPYPADMQRAEVCYAHVMLLIEEAARETGRVAGPSWFIRDWWGARRDEAQSARDRERAVKAAMAKRGTEDAAGFASERAACIQEAIKAGAVPGMES
nr:hypothetical protein [uncultured Brevundimonas sp.]